MNLLDRFSTHLRDVLARAIHVAAELKNPEVEPIHLLFALNGQKGSVANEILNRVKINPAFLEQALVSLPTATPPSPTPHDKPAAVGILTPLSTNTKLVLEKTMLVAQENSHNFIGSEHLLSALIKHHDRLVEDVLRVNGTKTEDIEKQLETVITNASQFPHMNEVSEVVEKIQDNLGDMLPGEHDDRDHGHHFEPKQRGRRRESALDFFGTELTNPEIQKNIDPVVGREKEIERVIQIICRRTKNNPLLLGEPGVGKTAIVEGLAKRIVEGTVPELLFNKKIYALDMGMMIAGTIYRGEFEGRLRQVIDEASNNPNVILFIDEIHNIVGAGSNQGTMDAANILKPALARGTIRCIGATTPAEFKKYIENDAALERRFQTVFARQPNLDDTVAILRGIRKNYEAYHSLTILDEAVVAAAKLADRYITNKFLPDKAIDLLDEAAAAMRLKAKVPAAQSKLWRLEQKLEKVILQKEAAARDDKFTEAVAFKKEEETLKAEIKEAERARTKKRTKSLGTLTAKDVAQQLSQMTGTPPSELLLDDVATLSGLEKDLQRYIVGQDEVVKTVAQTIRRAELNLSNPDRPLASFLFIGESGVGKTELAKSLAKALYPASDALIKLDMSEFNESFGVSKLLGSPAGYVGYKESNQFSDKIKLNPYCVVLFDEIDKAHRDVVKLLLQILENGEITDSAGKKVSLKHAILILTTSLGSQENKRGSIGFGTGISEKKENAKKLKERLKEHFSPEVINRIDEICFFEPLDTDKLVKIAALELNRFNKQLEQYHTAVTCTDAVLRWMIARIQEEALGARDVRRAIRGEVEELVANKLLKGNIENTYQLSVIEEKLVLA